MDVRAYHRSILVDEDEEAYVPWESPPIEEQPLDVQVESARAMLGVAQAELCDCNEALVALLRWAHRIAAVLDMEGAHALDVMEAARDELRRLREVDQDDGRQMSLF